MAHMHSSCELRTACLITTRPIRNVDLPAPCTHTAVARPERTAKQLNHRMAALPCHPTPSVIYCNVSQHVRLAMVHKHPCERKCKGPHNLETHCAGWR